MSKTHCNVPNRHRRKEERTRGCGGVVLMVVKAEVSCGGYEQALITIFMFLVEELLGYITQ
jgi:hypothetical protein